jgi:hypothetical protein
MTKSKKYKEEQNQPAIDISVKGEVTQVYGIFFIFFCDKQQPMARATGNK